MITMKSFASLFMLASAVGASSLLERAACNADNCARAVTGKSVSLSRINTDCVSYQVTTTYPPAVTVTTTYGSVATTIRPAGPQSTIIAPSLIPVYATNACSSGGNIASRFASACSCAGITKTVSTASILTVTVVAPTTAAAATGDICDDTSYAAECALGDANGGTCFCVLTNTGTKTCIGNRSCRDPKSIVCASDTDCPGGETCVSTDSTECNSPRCFPSDYCKSVNAAYWLTRVPSSSTSTSAAPTPTGICDYTGYAGECNQGDANGGSCFCVLDTTGTSTCVGNRSCRDASVCASKTDCPAGETCVSPESTVCNNPRCFPSEYCVSVNAPNSPSRLFKRSDTRRILGA